MKQATSKLCSNQARYLATRHPSDLSAEEAVALREHLQICSACASTRETYMFLHAALRQLPPVAPLAQLPAELTSSKELSSAEQMTSEPLLQSDRKGLLLSLPVRRTHQKRHFLAAILICCMLLASVVVLVSFFHAGSPQVVGFPRHPISCHEETALGDSLLVQLCQKNQLVDINQSQRMGDYTIILQRAYVDANQLLFEYKALQNSTGKFVLLSLMHLDVTLQGNQSPIAFGNATGTSYLAELAFTQDMPSMVSVFNRGAFPQNLRTFDLLVTLRNFGLGSQEDMTHLHLVKGTVSFHFSLPFHTGNILNLDDSVKENGVTLTLFRAIIAPSATFFYIRGLHPAMLEDYTLSLNGQKISGSSTAGVPDALPDHQASYAVVSWLSSQPADQAGTLTLSLHLHNHPDTWIFTINLL